MKEWRKALSYQLYQQLGKDVPTLSGLFSQKLSRMFAIFAIPCMGLSQFTSMTRMTRFVPLGHKTFQKKLIREFVSILVLQWDWLYELTISFNLWWALLAMNVIIMSAGHVLHCSLKVPQAKLWSKVWESGS